MIKKLALALALLATASPALAANRTVQVHNRTGLGVDIVSVQLRNTHGRVYELLNENIWPGHYQNVVFDDGEGHGHCVYDIYAQFSNGVYAQRSNVNVCVTYSWDIYDRDNVVN